MRLLLLVVCVCLALAGASRAEAAAHKLYIVDRSKLVHLSDLVNALPAFQAAVSEDFAPVWGQDVELVVTDDPPADGWTLTVNDTSDTDGALGYHGFDGTHVFARVFAADSVEYGDTWQGCLTHELFELLADPYVDRLALGKRLWLVEVADPVEDDRFNYPREAADGSLVPISDFVTPAWYRRNGHGPFDFRRYVKRPGQILPGGYVSYWTGHGWRQLYG